MVDSDPNHDGPPTDGDGSPRVYLDVMLGKLARLLRMAGWNAAYALDRGVEADDEILRETTAEDRLLVTRDRQLAERAPESLLVTTRDVDDQVQELRDAGFPVELDTPERCATCNGELEPVTADDTPAYAPTPDETTVWRCSDCGQHFWRGSHWRGVQTRLAERENGTATGPQ